MDKLCGLTSRAHTPGAVESLTCELSVPCATEGREWGWLEGGMWAGPSLGLHLPQGTWNHTLNSQHLPLPS